MGSVQGHDVRLARCGLQTLKHWACIGQQEITTMFKVILLNCRVAKDLRPAMAALFAALTESEDCKVVLQILLRLIPDSGSP